MLKKGLIRHSIESYKGPIFWVGACLLSADGAFAESQRYQELEGGVSPASVEQTLKSDVISSGYRFDGLKGLLPSYYSFKDELKKDHGLAFGIDYTSLYQKADETITDDDVGFGGIVRLYGSLSAYETDSGSKGSFVIKAENRHDLDSKLVPQSLGGQFGYSGLTGAQFGDSDGWILTNLYWQQRAEDERLNFIAGIIDPTDYLNVYALVDPLKSFSNLAFLTGQTIAAPSQGVGGVVGWTPHESYYVIGGIYDTNGNPGKPEDAFDSFFSEGEYFKQIEIGWFSSFDKRYLDNVHITLWQSDERDDAAIDNDKGIALSATTFINDQWMPFFRAGYADGTAALFQKEVAVGLGYYFDDVKDLIGVGASWGEPSEDSFGKGIDDEKAVEVFYRLQLTPELAITPDLQLIFDPAQNSNEDLVTVLGLRVRIDL